MRRLAPFSLCTLVIACNLGGPADSVVGAKSDPATEAVPAVGGGFDVSDFENRAVTKMDEVMKKPQVDAAMTSAWDEIGADPKVAGAGEALLTGIGSHEEFAPAAGEFMGKLQTSEKFIKLITDFAAANPQAGAGGLEVAFAQHVDAQVGRPAVNQAIDASIGRIMEKPELQAGLGKLTHIITEQSGVSKEISHSFVTKLSSPSALEKLEAKTGAKAGDADYEDELFAYLTEEARLEKFMVGFAQQFGAHPAPRTAVTDLLENHAVLEASAGQLRKIMEAPEFYPRAEAALVAVLDGSDQATVESKLDTLLDQPEVLSAFGGWFDALAEVPEVKSGFGTAFHDVVSDDAFDQLIVDSFLE